MIPLTSASGFLGARPATSGLLVLAAACVSIGMVTRPFRKTKKELYIPSPGITVLPILSQREVQNLPYPPDALPGGRNVETPYGSVRVYEWGPDDGERVLFVPGISTPIVSLGDLAHEMAGRGYRVMMFDLFGRGYSDAPIDLSYDARLYTTQILLVLASSSLPWTASPGFHLVGYSLGGGLSVAFTRYFPHLVRSLSLVATGGLIRPYHVDWRSWLYYSSGSLPEFLVRALVKRRLRPRAMPVHGTDIIAAESEQKVDGDGDCNGGEGFDSAFISRRQPGVTVSSVVRWQVDNHPGFVGAFLSTIRNAPIYAPQEDWVALSSILRSRRNGSAGLKLGIQGGKILIVLGEDDPVVVRGETVADAEAVLGSDGVQVTVLAGGHELPMTRSSGVADAIERSWNE
ncbi:Uu.00g044280.m01.CDS01 [Anthostomella pinea]|uniref:Uu.00g044280.m01.CDS01 n=1 Tax=Anthostomella pinea TaxID=933095 RepID=A0AAI8VAY1_9PEZI|nr:Uu.00g044280.m01.CDS01 [Anthostomella pinea]